MISENVVIICDHCGRTTARHARILYRVSGTVTEFINELKDSGWIFRRDKQHKLIDTECDECLLKRGEP